MLLAQRKWQSVVLNIFLIIIIRRNKKTRVPTEDDLADSIIGRHCFDNSTVVEFVKARLPFYYLGIETNEPHSQIFKTRNKLGMALARAKEARMYPTGNP